MNRHFMLLPIMWVCTATVPAAEIPATVPAAAHAGHAQAGRGWTAYPLLKPKMSGTERGKWGVTVVPQNLVAHGLFAFSNNLHDMEGRRQLPMTMAGAVLDQPANGGFHWLAAREVADGEIRVASTVYSFGERGAQSPGEMFAQVKHELEIIPEPYPREHSRYRAGESWRFLVRFEGRPLAGQRVELQTSNGSAQEIVSDALGMLHVQIPDDFGQKESVQAGHDHGRPGADFVLATRHASAGMSYLTAFNSSYGKNAFDQRSLSMGLGFTLLGMLGAAPLLRQRKKNQPKAEAHAHG